MQGDLSAMKQREFDLRKRINAFLNKDAEITLVGVIIYLCVRKIFLLWFSICVSVPMPLVMELFSSWSMQAILSSNSFLKQ
jgi:hypothetical protein